MSMGESSLQSEFEKEMLREKALVLKDYLSREDFNRLSQEYVYYKTMHNNCEPWYVWFVDRLDVTVTVTVTVKQL